VHSLSGRPATFWDLAQRSLDYAIASVGGAVSSEVRAKLLAAYRAMDAYPEVAEMLAALKARGAKLAILSNGDPDMLDDAVRAAKLENLFDAVLSVTSAGHLQAGARGLHARHRALQVQAGGDFVPVFEPLGHRRRQGVRLPLRMGQPRGCAGRISRPAAGPHRERSARVSGVRSPTGGGMVSDPEGLTPTLRLTSETKRASSLLPSGSRMKAPK